MIVENQKNIKVHFAGSEQIDFSMVASKAESDTHFPVIVTKEK